MYLQLELFVEKYQKKKNTYKSDLIDIDKPKRMKDAYNVHSLNHSLNRPFAI